jgi:hypothetical protein
MWHLKSLDGIDAQYLYYKDALAYIKRFMKAKQYLIYWEPTP